MAKRRKRRRRFRGWFVLVGLGLVMLGFLVRRSLMPLAHTYLTTRPAPNRMQMPVSEQRAPLEELNDSDRDRMDKLLRERTK